MRPSHDPSLVDEVDIALVHALQIAPRASWAVVGRALGVDPGTAARRWQRLVEHGLAWVTCYPADRHMEDRGSAYIEVDCEPGHVSDVGEQLTRQSHVVTVEHVSGEHNLLLMILAPGLVNLSHYLMHGLSVLPGVRRTRVHVATRLFREASDWQLHALDAAQQQVLRPPPADRDAAQPLTRVDTELAVLLSGNGRMPIVELAQRLDVSEATVGRRLRRLLASGRLVLRTELAQPWTGRPVNSVVRSWVPPDQLESAGLALATLPGIRQCAATTGDAVNLQLALWLRSVEETSRLEAEIVRRVPSLRIRHRLLGLRYLKRMGQLIGHDTSAGNVPLHVWAPAG